MSVNDNPQALAHRHILGPDRGMDPLRRGLAERFVKRAVAQIEIGSLIVELPNGLRIEHRGPISGPEGHLILHRWRAAWRSLIGGDISFAEAYRDGDWSSPDLPRLIEMMALNLRRLEDASTGFGPLKALRHLGHLRSRNSHKGSRRNIAYHYDLGNEFYRHWLDQGMSYSSALFGSGEQSLEQAQVSKQVRVAELLKLEGGERILEIGLGWGGLARHLIERHGAQVTGLTLSTEQLSHAQATIEHAGLTGAADFRLQDYRDVNGRFDRVVSIEMFEAVGEQYWPHYFDVLRRSLSATGVAVLQIITIDHSRFEAYRRGVDFIQRHIFPGGMLPSEPVLVNQIERAGLTLQSAETFGASYARTLAEWRRRFEAQWPAIHALGFDPGFKRLWEYYLSYCEAGFATGLLNVGLYQLKHSGSPVAR
jgi:cyclopropane-fatty-acyl-phospholipid synthase